MNEFFDSLHPRSDTKVVIESSGMWYNMYEYLTKRHIDVRLSNPAKTRAIASAKIMRFPEVSLDEIREHTKCYTKRLSPRSRCGFV